MLRVILLAISLVIGVACWCDEPVTRMTPIRASEISHWHNVGLDKLVRLTNSGPVPQVIRDAAPSICLVRVKGLDGASYQGSGTYIGANTVVTAKHVVREGSMPTVVAQFSGRSYQSKTWLGNKQADQFIFQLTETPSVRPIPIAQTPPGDGETVWVMGFGGGNFDIWPARFSGQGSTTGGPKDTTDYTGPRGAISGDSGGAVLNSKGEYVGTIWGSSGNQTAAVSYSHTQSFFQRTGLLARLFGRQGITQHQSFSGVMSGGGCGTGTCPPQQQMPPSQQGGQSYPAPDYYEDPVPDPVPNQPGANPPTACNCEPCDEKTIADAVISQIKSNPSMRGPAGQDGMMGMPGLSGERGPVGASGRDGKDAVVDYDTLAAEVAKRLPPHNRRVILVDGKTRQVIDNETYGPNEPIVLDLQRFVNAATAR